MIRKAKPDDIDGIIHVLRSYDFTVLPEESGSLIDTRFPDKFMLSNTVTEFVWERSFVAEVEGSIVGFCHYTLIDEHRAKTRLLVVHPQYRGLGLGKQLQIARMKEAYDSGVLELHTHSEHPDSVSWYKKHFNYKDCGTTESIHGLVFFRVPGRIIWGVHYGFKDHPVHTALICNLQQYFADNAEP